MLIKQIAVSLQSRNYGVKNTFNKFNLKQVNTLSYKSVSANKKTVNKEWVVVDAQGEILGRLSTKIAMIIRGKHKPGFTPHVDCGDNVIVINADKVKLTGNKFAEKQYVSYTGYPGGQRFISPKELMAKHPTRVVEKAVRGMLPKYRLGRALFGNLLVYAGAEHPHAAQNPKAI
ncbi:MAG: rplM [Mucilaginibacter sp.]|nr:rplM [Mucilaginibacter sp.]